MAIKYKLVNADFDGTTTNRAGMVTERAVRAINNYIENGGIFIMNTGRSYNSIVNRMCEIYRPMRDVPIACVQGGQIWQHGKMIKRNVMDKCELLRLIEEFSEDTDPDKYIQIYCGDNLYAEKPHKWATMYAEATLTKQTFVGDLYEFFKCSDEPVDKFLVIDSKSKTRANYIRYAQDNLFEKTKFVYSTSTFFEGIPKESGKDGALRFFAGMYNVDISETAAIGDGNNDSDMLMCAGYGCAMGNGADELKQVADGITSDRDDEGLAKFMESLII